MLKRGDAVTVVKDETVGTSAFVGDQGKIIDCAPIPHRPGLENKVEFSSGRQVWFNTTELEKVSKK